MDTVRGSLFKSQQTTFKSTEIINRQFSISLTKPEQTAPTLYIQLLINI